jgi:membrane protease YdiL (CAAX protease family)
LNEPPQQPGPATSVPSVPLRQPASGDWTVRGALAFAIFVVIASQLSGFLALKLGLLGAITADARQALPLAQVLIQLIQLALAWFLAGATADERMRALNLEPARISAGTMVGYVFLLLAVKTVATMVAAGLVPFDSRQEMEPFRGFLTDTVSRMGFLFAVLLAGLTEEMVFRGVLSRTLERTRLGFWAGAAVASAIFAIIHLQYGAGGQLVVFSIGMTLAWMRARTGSLWPAVICHAANNGLAYLALLAVSR